MSNNYMSSNYKINGYNVHRTYAGIDQYTVYKDGKEIGTCWDLGTLEKWTKTDIETIKEEMWKQRYNNR